MCYRKSAETGRDFQQLLVVTLRFPLRPNEQEPFSNLALEVGQLSRNA